MLESINVLILAALGLGLTHTAIGPDHYLPFVVLARSEGWSLKRTLFWTFLCGVGHVGSSVVVGGLGIGLGWSLSGMEWFEGVRGDLASYVLMGFGAVYMLWGIFQARRGGHAHVHVHADGTVHKHAHDHGTGADDDGHERTAHEDTGHVRQHRRTLWVIFIIFVLGPCEPLIPLLLVPASEHSIAGIAAVAGVFAVATIGTMLTAVTFGYMGLRFVNFGFLEKYVHALSGGAILVSGLLIQVLGI